MNAYDNLDKVTKVVCYCGSEIWFGIGDIQQTKYFKKPYIICPNCGEKLLLRDDIRQYIGKYGYSCVIRL